MAASTHRHDLDGVDLVKKRFRWPILAPLQIAIHYVVYGVQNRTGANDLPVALWQASLGGVGRSQIGVNRLLPVAQPCEDMRRHVQRMGRGVRNDRKRRAASNPSPARAG